MSYGTQTLAKYHDNRFVTESLAFQGINAKDEPVTFWENSVSVVSHVQPDFIYVRYEPMLHSPTLARFFEQVGQQSSALKCIEFPTYPYESELPDANLDTVRANRQAMLEHVDHVFSTSYEPRIMGSVNHPFDNQLSESMINDFAKYRLASSPNKSEGINLLVVANLSLWHGVDRILKGMMEYYGAPHATTVNLDIVGEGEALPKLKALANEMKLHRSVQFHGFKSGDALNKLFIGADVAIGSLGIHRINLYRSSTLKVREYLASGLPVIYSCEDTVLYDNPYALKVPENDTAVDINDVVKFYKALTAIEIRKTDIAKFARNRISWRVVASNVLAVVKRDKLG
ncbi:MAG: glycosyltransferase family 4 protein [Alteromonadaceae bacterium]|nr:glycosyltransferase family 4 protein [Alteromonadaceae bacterium]